jgi:trimethylguanosine synthase
VFISRNTDLQPLVDALSLGGRNAHFEVEKNFLNGKLKAITLYFGELACRVNP